MGEVIFCEDLHLQRQVVLKHLQAGVESRRLLDEQKALSKVRSKHVVQLYDIVNIPGEPFRRNLPSSLNLLTEKHLVQLVFPLTQIIYI